MGANTMQARIPNASPKSNGNSLCDNMSKFFQIIPSSQLALVLPS